MVDRFNHFQVNHHDGSKNERSAVDTDHPLLIPVLVLTTSIGGLGLNLTGADTVIFMEHSWNPFTDLQAMDRCHRIGQTKPVTVFRLLAQDTVEAQVMTCQRFKTAVAEAVIGRHDSSSHGPSRKQVDLFQTFKTDSTLPPPSTRRKKRKTTLGTGLDAMLAELGELWDEAQYASLEKPAY